ncbi:MAG: C39 family peptidase [Clostridia bacterium]|nr:C39 family peptidase [Clostridia bacterium]
MKKPIKIVVCVLCSLILAVGLVLAISFAVLAGKTNYIDDDYSDVYTDEKYSAAVGVENIEVITQEVSCGYAVLQMFSAWNGGSVTEQSLFEKYGKVVTSTGNSFCKEFNKQFPEYRTKIYKYLKNSELIDKVYQSLAGGIPVPFEWAAKYHDEWTLHYSLIIGMDIANDTVKVANPYGYIEQLSLKEFLDRTSYKAFEHMPFFYRLAFAFGVFEKNTVFIATKRI